ncbi:hypothetical protein HPB49_014224 [Dermacentor silvarum]|uniref:Uncharacterized protein n=1 Tax=Dermacentor silvarum TaxID=543639 RepID=A0ACB8DDU3_DERSI|nr:hypothetical protein HPB49_014224 [Dermacentor silvarum]
MPKRRRKYLYEADATVPARTELRLRSADFPPGDSGTAGQQGTSASHDEGEASTSAILETCGETFGVLRTAEGSPANLAFSDDISDTEICGDVDDHDYMHAVCLGFVRSVTCLWLSSKRKKKFSLSVYIKELNQRLTSLQPVHEIGRLPRSLDESKTLSHLTSKEQQVSWAVRCLPKSQGQNDKTKPHIQPSRDADTNTNNTVQALAALVQELRVEIAELRAQQKEERSRNKPPAQESSPEPRTPPQPPQRASTASVVQETVEEMNTEAPPEPNPTAQPIDVRVTACEKGIHENRKAIQELHMRMEKGFDDIRQMITHLHEVFTPLVNDQRHKKPRVYPHRVAALQQMLQEDQNGQKTE